MGKPNKLPPKIPVLHVYYRLDGKKKFKDNTCGLTTIRGRAKSIEIADTQDEPAIWSATFWHEWFHAAFNELGHMEDYNSEAKVEGLAHAMMSMFRDPHGRQMLRLMLKGVPEML